MQRLNISRHYILRAAKLVAALDFGPLRNSAKVAKAAVRMRTILVRDLEFSGNLMQCLGLLGRQWWVKGSLYVNRTILTTLGRGERSVGMAWFTNRVFSVR